MIKQCSNVFFNSAGYLLDKYPRHRYTLLFMYTAIMGLACTMIPLSPSLYFFFGLCAIYGFVMGSLEVGGNVLCLDVWQGFDESGPYMHSLHFSWGVGAFLAPLIAEKFLDNRNDIIHSSNRTKAINELSETSVSDANDGPGIEILYSILGLFTILVSIGYLIYAIKGFEMNEYYNSSYKKLTQQKKTASNNFIVICLIYRCDVGKLILAFLFIYVGMEKLYGTYLATFTVRSELHLSRKVGVRITAVFWGSFMMMRLVAIFISLRLSPLGILLFGFFMSLVGSTLLALFAESSVIAMGIFTSFMGIGMAPIYASSILWMDQFMKVTNKIGGLMTVSSGIATDAFPLLLGQFIASFPMLLMYLQVCLMYFCVVLFAFATWVGRRKSINRSNS